MSDKVVTVAIVGNPNCGKTSLFNALTGARQKVGNWPGVTVDRKEGTFQYDGRQVRVIDLPGVYSLAVAGASSIDERIARDYILSQAADVIVNILDASNLERNFYLTTQLLEMGVPMILALNMMDAARSKGLVIDTQSFQDRLGLPVRGVVAPTGEGLDLLKAAMAASAVRQYKPKLSVEFGTALEAEIVQLAALLPQKSNSNPTYARWTAIKLLEDDTSVAEKFDDSIKQAVVAAQARISDATKEDTDILIADRRFSA